MVLEGIVSITDKSPSFHNIDLKHKAEVEAFFKAHNDIAGVIHFAASKAVGESVNEPLLYYENNINTLVYMLQNITRLKQAPFIFSSSCTVYGEAETLPISETSKIQPALSPYGNTKQIGEEIISDVCKANTQFNAIALRYFNPIGSHESAKIGELPLGVPQNLVPFITQTGVGIREQLSVFGDTYPTQDGTCIRDYIHVVDLAKAHVIALKRLIDGENTSNYEVFNLGTGQGSSVLEVIQSFERVSNQSLNYKIVDKREGDVVAAYANTTKAKEVLKWTAQSSLDEAMASAWKWQQQLNNDK